MWQRSIVLISYCKRKSLKKIGEEVFYNKKVRKIPNTRLITISNFDEKNVDKFQEIIEIS